jgi:hypothetical protein
MRLEASVRGSGSIQFIQVFKRICPLTTKYTAVSFAGRVLWQRGVITSDVNVQLLKLIDSDSLAGYETL